MKMIIPKIILIIILLIEIAAIILFHIKYLTQFSFHNFMSTLQDKINSKSTEEENLYYIYEEYEKVFGRYYDNAGLESGIKTIASFFVMILTILALTILIIWQFCNKCRECKRCCFIFFPIYSLLNMIIYISFAFSSKSDLELADDEIYIFDNEFNKEIKNNLQFMHERKIYLIVCIFVTIVGIIVQFIMIIIINKKENENKNDIAQQPQYVYQQPYNYQYNYNSNANVNINNENPDFKENIKSY